MNQSSPYEYNLVLIGSRLQVQNSWHISGPADFSRKFHLERRNEDKWRLRSWQSWDKRPVIRRGTKFAPTGRRSSDEHLIKRITYIAVPTSGIRSSVLHNVLRLDRNVIQVLNFGFDCKIRKWVKVEMNGTFLSFIFCQEIVISVT